jgi:hypothetical protein
MVLKALSASQSPVITIDPELKAKRPRTALGCLTALVEAGPSPAALIEEIKSAGGGDSEIALSAGVLESPQIEPTRST